MLYQFLHEIQAQGEKYQWYYKLKNLAVFHNASLIQITSPYEPFFHLQTTNLSLVFCLFSCYIFLLSIASAWEVAIKIGIGKLDIDGRTADFINDAQTNEITFLPIKPAHLTAYESLPMIHRDHFDRLLVATALAEQLTIITADEDIAKY
ncbi:MAG: type II toxin-antitoxin system VapC family toxin [Treponema sp.]|nr:type II toxin-antitoxin system VapC family toxin [Treponema sp.]